MYSEDPLSHNVLLKRSINSLVRERLPSLDGVVVDLGCGTAPFRDDILPYASQYIGVDWGNTLHASRADVVADLNGSLPFASEMADHVVSFEVIEHLAEPAQMLQEVVRILRPGGSFTLSAPFQWWEHEAPWDYQRYTRHGLRYQLQKVGLTDIQIRNTTGFWSMWFLKLNYQTARLLRGPRWLRKMIRIVLIPFWIMNQAVCPWLDRIWHEDRETAGYFVTALKPAAHQHVHS
jgi:SAM-dependent methyltransferase